MSTPLDAFDLLIVGFGPASLALSIALAEPTNSKKEFSSIGKLSESLRSHSASSIPTSNSNQRIRTAVIELSPSFSWHQGMLLEGSRMQISFLKDLATLRNPSSSYTFLNYLHSFTPSRLVSFISLGTFAPTRREYSAYMNWAAKKVQLELEAAGGAFGFGEKVEKVEAVLTPISGAGPLSGDENQVKSISRDVKVLKITSRHLQTGEEIIRFSKNIIFSTGGAPRIPREFLNAEPTGRLIHTSKFLYQVPSILAEIVKSTPPFQQIRIAVIGGGQSSSECFLAVKSYLNKLLPSSMAARPQIDLFIRKAALRPADDSPFSNEAFDPCMSQATYDMDEHSRSTFMKEVRGTNYSVANPVTLEAIYAEMYAQTVDEDTNKLDGQDPTVTLNTDAKLQINPYSNIFHVAPTASSTNPSITLSVENSLTHRTRTLAYDLVILGTGYNRDAWKEILFSATQSTEENVASIASLFESHEQIQKEVESPVFSEATSRNSSAGSPLGRNVKLGSIPFSSDTDLPEFTLRPAHPEHETEFIRGRSTGVTGGVKEMNFKIRKNYRLDLPAQYSSLSGGGAGKFAPSIWLQGCNEESFGISDSLLSVLAVRSGEVISALKAEGNF